MSGTNEILAITLAAMGAVFLVFAVLFFRRKERACALIAGFNAMTEKEHARYDRAAIARDYGRLFAAWAAGAFVFAGLALLWGWISFGVAAALLIFSVIPRMHLWPENAFRQYKIDQ